jgi:acetate---CoA ligase (ADP-forming) subunit alpha
MPVDLKHLFEPESIAVIGASKDELKSGGMFVSALLKDGYKGIIYPVNRKEPEIQSLKSYPTVLDVPGKIDLAIMAIPARGLLQAMVECAQKGVRFAIVHSVGFSELGDEGKGLEKQMVEAARMGGVRIVGPNCMGIFSPKGHINTIVPHARVPLEPGGVAFVGQSGWISENMTRLGSDRGLRFSGIISIGNQSDLTIEDFLEYFGDDEETRIFVAYIEGLKQPSRFLKLAEEISKRKPVIVWKGGESELGARAAQSHTGSLAGNYAVFEAACRQKGIVFAQSLEEMLDLAVAFSCPYLPAGREVGLLMEAGGGAVAASDACTKARLKISPLPQGVQQQLQGFLNGKVPLSKARANPVDLVWVDFEDALEVYSTAIEMIVPEVDSCLCICYAFLEDEAFLSRLENIRDRNRKPIMMIPGNSLDQHQGMRMATQRGIPTYVMPDNAVRALAAMTWRAEYLKSLLANS